MTTTTRTKAEDIRPGTVIVFLGHPHLITEIADYTGPFDFIIGIARDATGWGISLEAGGYYDTAKDPAK